MSLTVGGCTAGVSDNGDAGCSIEEQPKGTARASDIHSSREGFTYVFEFLCTDCASGEPRVVVHTYEAERMALPCIPQVRFETFNVFA